MHNRTLGTHALIPLSYLPTRCHCILSGGGNGRSRRGEALGISHRLHRSLHYRENPSFHGEIHTCFTSFLAFPPTRWHPLWWLTRQRMKQRARSAGPSPTSSARRRGWAWRTSPAPAPSPPPSPAPTGRRSPSPLSRAGRWASALTSPASGSGASSGWTSPSS